MLRPRRSATRSRSGPTRVCGPTRLNGLDRRPAHQPGALLGDPAAVHVGVGLVVLGGQPGPAGQLRQRCEPGDVADLGDEHRPQHGPDRRGSAGPRGSRGRCATGRGPAWRTGRSRSPEPSISRRSEAIRARDRAPSSCSRSSSAVPVQAEQVAHRHLDPALGQHRVDLGLAVASAARPAWPGAAPARAAPGSPVGRSTPRAAGPSAADRPDRRRRGRRSSPAGTRTPSPPTGAPDAPARRAACRASTAQYQPYVASSTTSGPPRPGPSPRSSATRRRW